MQPIERELILEFLDNFKQVFDDDWGHTESMLRDGTFAYQPISGEGTFLNPGVDDESANWSSRGALLQSYRELIAYLKENELIEADY